MSPTPTAPGAALGPRPRWPPNGDSCLPAEEVTRDFAYGEADPLIRKCMLLPWAPADMLDLSSCTPEPPDQHYQVRPSALPLRPWASLVASGTFSTRPLQEVEKSLGAPERQGAQSLGARPGP